MAKRAPRDEHEELSPLDKLLARDELERGEDGPSLLERPARPARHRRPDEVKAATAVRIPRPDLGAGMATVVQAGDVVPAHLVGYPREPIT